jgi:uncharacterized membrane protein
MTKRQKVSLYIMSVFYLAAGIYHFVNPMFYKKIMPPYLPWHFPLIYLSGAAEIVLGVFLLPVRTRKLAAWGIFVLLVVVFPANVQMLLNYREEENPDVWIAIVRLPLQLLLIWGAYLFTQKMENESD